MYSEKASILGEHASVAEELLAAVPNLEQKCKAVEKAVREGYFTFQEALVNYNVSEIEYLPYLILKRNADLKTAGKQEQAFAIMTTVFSVFSPAADSFSPNGKKAFYEAQRISASASRQ